MAKKVAKLEVEIVGNDAKLKRTLNDSKQDTNDWGDNMLRVGRAAITSMAAIGAGAAAATILINNMVAQEAELAKVLRNQANVADLTTQSFQELAYATSSVEIDGDKFGDILQDMQDKLGEFRRDGGGEFAAFFEIVGAKVGLTADALAKLSGPDALIAVKNAMDEVNVSADQQTTYLEEIASDASRLMPLLKNNGEQWRKMAQNYREMDVALSNSEMKELQNYTKNVRELGLVWDDLSRSVVMPFVNLLAEGAANMKELFNTSITEQITTNIRYQENAVKRIATLKDKLDLYSDKPEDRSKSEEKKYQRFKRSHDAQLKFLKVLKDARKDLDNPEGVGDLKTNLGTRGDIENKFGVNSGGDSGSVGPVDKGAASKLASQQKQSVAYLSQLDNQFATEIERLDLQKQRRETKIRELILSEEQIKAAGFESMQGLQAAYIDNSDQLYSEQTEKYLQRQILEEQRKYEAVERALQFDLSEEEREYAAAERRQLIIDEAFKGRADSEDAFIAASTKNWAAYEKNLQKIQRERTKIDIQEKADLYGGLAGLAKTFAGQQSGIYKAMFLAQKAYVLQGVLLENKGAIAKAWNSAPFPANLAAVGITLAKTGVLQSAVEAISPPAYHTGGIIGEQPNLRPNEFPMIGLRGEEVLTESDSRHRNNLSNRSGSKSGANTFNFVIHNSVGPAEVSAEQNEDGRMHLYLEKADLHAAAGIANQDSELYFTLEAAGAINPANTAF